MLIQEAALKTPYRILGIDLPKENLKHLSNLGVTVGETLEVITKTKESAIIVIRGSRLAFDGSILNAITIGPIEGQLATIPLSDLTVGEFGIVADIFAVSEAKRRLMDMGITKKTKIYLRKVAPLGDPIEVTLRGYELTLRKSEAQMISVIRMKEEEKV